MNSLADRNWPKIMMSFKLRGSNIYRIETFGVVENDTMDRSYLLVYNHYVTMPMQYTSDIYGCRNENFRWKIVISFSFFLDT